MLAVPGTRMHGCDQGARGRGIVGRNRIDGRNDRLPGIRESVQQRRIIGEHLRIRDQRDVRDRLRNVGQLRIFEGV